MTATPNTLDQAATPLPSAAYRAKLESGALREDPEQLALTARFDQLWRELDDYPEVTGRSGLSIASWRLAGLFRPGHNRQPKTPRGLYIYGGVGRGKSMLMDLFFELAPVTNKRRIHFHAFMQDIHTRLKEWRSLSSRERVARGGRATEDDPIPPVARSIALEATLLCFDEFQVTDIADAMVLGRLFAELFEAGVVVVATSNRPPSDLYKEGLNRQLFLPFIGMLEDRLDIVSLNGPTDYRMDRLIGMQTWFTPIGPAATQAMSASFFELTDYDPKDRAKVPFGTLSVGQREIFVPKSVKGVAVFSFKRLCVNPLGPADYLAISQAYHTVFVVAVPALSPAKRNEAKRFVTMIDAFYEAKVKLFASAETAPQNLYPSGDGAFEFERTVSRLLEMQSEDYLQQAHSQQTAVKSAS